jgi:hypothetical protein
MGDFPIQYSSAVSNNEILGGTFTYGVIPTQLLVLNHDVSRRYAKLSRRPINYVDLLVG